MRLLVTVLVALWLVPNSAFAQVINSCVKPNGGLRVVADPTACNNNETTLSWNQQVNRPVFSGDSVT